MNGRNFIYFIKEGIKGIFVHGFMSFAAVSVIVACLIITGTFSLVVMNVNVLIDRVEDENEILAFVDDSLDDTEALALITQIAAVPNVASATFVTRDEALDEWAATLPEDYRDMMLTGITSADLRHRYVIKTEDLSLAEDTAAEIAEIDGVEVQFDPRLSDATLSMQNVIRIVSYILAVILFIVSMFMIANTVKLATFDRREEIGIMKIVGATNSFIRWPFVIQGALLGLVGGAIAFFAQWGIYNYACNLMLNYVGLEMLGDELISFASIAIRMLLIFLGVGFTVGVLGGSLTIRKFMRV